MAFDMAMADEDIMSSSSHAIAGLACTSVATDAAVMARTRSLRLYLAAGALFSILHSFWDSRLGSNNLLPSTIGTRAVEAMNTYKAEAEKAALCLDVEHWLQESHQLTVDVAYSPAIMEGVAEQEDTGTSLVPIAISDEYKTTAGDVSQRRVAEAGYRLARLLEYVLGD